MQSGINLGRADDLRFSEENARLEGMPFSEGHGCSA